MAGLDSTQSSPPKTAFWRDPKKRALAFQIIVLCSVFAFVAYIFNNTLINLEKRGISTGFGFLQLEAGFGVLMSLIPYNETNSFGRTFVVGLLNTLLVASLGIVCATLLGFIMGVARLSRNWLIARLATIYIEVFRNLPLLLQILFWYFAILPLLPNPRQSFNLGEAIFLNKRGFYMPASNSGGGHCAHHCRCRNPAAQPLGAPPPRSNRPAVSGFPNGIGLNRRSAVDRLFDYGRAVDLGISRI